MVIITERLIIREFELADWKEVHIYASDPETLRYMSWGPNTEKDTIESLQNMITSQKQNPRFRYALAITLKTEGTVIGGCELVVHEHSQGSLGYCLNRQYWGTGYATEAIYALCSLAFDRFKLHRIFATCRPDNVPSCRVIEKIGMQREGLLREHFYAKGKWHNSFLYSILINEFIFGNMPSYISELEQFSHYSDTVLEVENNDELTI